MELTVVLIQPPIRTTHGFIVGSTVIQAPALPLVSPMVDHTMASQTTVLVFAWIRVAGMSYKPYREKKEEKIVVGVFTIAAIICWFVHVLIKIKVYVCI